MTTDAGRITPRATRRSVRPSGVLTVVLAAYVVLAAQYAARTPDWQVPDEPAHYNYVRFVVERGALPVLRPGDYDQAYNERFTNPRNTPSMSIDPLRYESWQPPLYYLLAAPVYALTGGSLLALRLFSVALGGAQIAAAYLTVREIFSHAPTLALGTAAFVAFIPQHVAMLSGVNNDALAELLLALTLLQIVRVLKTPSTLILPYIILGLFLGLGFLTKGTNYLIAPVAMLAIVFRSRQPPSSFFILHSAFVLIPALALGSLWWLRNIGVYGGLDILGLVNHNAVVVGQPLTSDWVARLGFGPFLISALTTTFHSFWGQFGWMGVPMPDAFYLALGALCLVALTGWLLSLRERPVTPTLPYSSTLLVLLTLVTFGYYIFYNVTFVQHQGRYLFPALIPLGLVFSLGIERWTRRLPRPLNVMTPAGVFAALAALDVWALVRFIIPSLAT